jgi:hypothetical protein
MGRNRHPISEWGVTGRNGVRLPLDLHQAHATIADWFQSLVVTERRDRYSSRATGVQHRNGVVELVLLPVYRCFHRPWLTENRVPCDRQVQSATGNHFARNFPQICA